MIGALVLIAVGVVLLLTNLGVVGGSIWLGMLELWPIVLVAVGVTLLLPREARVARTSVAAVAIAALATGGWAMSERDGPLRGRSADVGIALGDTSRADVDLDMGAGRLHLRGAAEPGEVISGTIGLSRGQRLVADGAERGDIARARIAAEGRWFRLGVNPTSVEPWNLRLTDEVPVQLRVSTGLGETRLDLSGLTVEEARVDVGIGRTKVALPDRGRPRVRVDGGIGETIVRIPAGIPARIAVTTGIGAATVDDDFVRAGEVYTSPGWEDATNRLDVVVDSGIGTVRVEREAEGDDSAG